ncbi:hypothetical protein ACFLZM_02415 [Thermodesulfobacteriota bacterium]
MPCKIQVILAENHQFGNSEPTNVSDENRAAWQAKMEVFNNYKRKLDDIGGNLADKAAGNPIYQEAGMYITDIAVILGLLKIVYTLNTNCLQTHLTIRDLYKQILSALSHTLNMIDYNKLKIDELYNKTKDTDAIRVIGEGKEILKNLQKTLNDEREGIFSKLRDIKQ